MTTKQSSQTSFIQPSRMSRPMLIGAGIGLALISLFLYGVNDPDAAWGKFWVVRPMIMVSLAGAAGGAVFYFLNQLSNQGKLNKSVAVVLSIIIFIIGLWMGSVLGLDGTLWN